MKELSLRQIVSSDNWIITEVKQGYDKQVRISAKTRFYRQGEQNSFCEWYSFSYANRLYRENYIKSLEKTNKKGQMSS